MFLQQVVCLCLDVEVVRWQFCCRCCVVVMCTLLVGLFLPSMVALMALMFELFDVGVDGANVFELLMLALMAPMFLNC